MEIIVAGYEIIDQKPGLDGLYEAAELPGRICYHSMDKKTPDSAKPFVDRLIKANHGAPLEHGTVYLTTTDSDVADFYSFNKFSHVNSITKYPSEETGKDIPNIYNVPTTTYYITTNLRVLFENGQLDDLKYFTEPTEHHEKRVMVRFTIDRFTGEEFLRHRVASFNRESTRYVCFTKEKFGGGSITYIIPCWMLDENGEISEEILKARSVFDTNFEDKCGEIFNAFEYKNELKWRDFDYWFFALKATEWSYCNLVNKCGWQAQQARTVLPCAINSPLIMTAFIKDWKHFFNLRAKGTTGAPHPQAKELAYPLMDEFIKRGYIDATFAE